MKQQPEFSMIGSSLFIYLTYYWFKTQSKKKIEDIVKDIVKDKDVIIGPLFQTNSQEI